MHKGRTWIEERKQRYRLFLDSVIYNNHWEISGNIHIHRIDNHIELKIYMFCRFGSLSMFYFRRSHILFPPP